MEYSKPTAAQALDEQLRTSRGLYVRGDNWDRTAAQIIAANALDRDLDKFAEPAFQYELTNEQRDRLLVHARRDAAAARYYLGSLSDDVYKVKQELRWISFLIVIGAAVYVAKAYWASTTVSDNQWWLAILSVAVGTFWCWLLYRIGMGLYRAMAWRLQAIWAVIWNRIFPR